MKQKYTFTNLVLTNVASSRARGVYVDGPQTRLGFASREPRLGTLGHGGGKARDDIRHEEVVDRALQRDGRIKLSTLLVRVRRTVHPQGGFNLGHLPKVRGDGNQAIVHLLVRVVRKRNTGKLTQRAKNSPILAGLDRKSVV